MSATDSRCDGTTGYGIRCSDPPRYAVKREDSPAGVDLSTGCGKHLAQLVTAASHGDSRVIVVVIPKESE